jgi:hypothetical protein
MNDDTFYSIDRLVEFGLGMGVAQQMTASMNQAIQNTRFPGPGSIPASRSYHLVLEDKAAGPFSEHELSRLISDSKLTRTTLVWSPGMPGWKRAEDVAEILRLVALAPPPFNGETV